MKQALLVICCLAGTSFAHQGDRAAAVNIERVVNEQMSAHKIPGVSLAVLRPTTAQLISEADIVPNRAAVYRLVKGELKNQEWVSPSTNSTADGSYYVSILDLAKWDAALYTDKP